jgi:hypothetical protein
VKSVATFSSASDARPMDVIVMEALPGLELGDEGYAASAYSRPGPTFKATI